jgi:hypothetical protein
VQIRGNLLAGAAAQNRRLLDNRLRRRPGAAIDQPSQAFAIVPINHL